jgi:hypothetical protein
MNSSAAFRAVVASLFLSAAAGLAHAQAVTTAFTYQGELRDGSNLAQGPHDLRFEVLDEGERVLQILCADDVPVVDGRFTVLLDPGEEFAGLLREARSIRVLVRPDTGLLCDNEADFVPLSPTQPFTRAPLATRASVADRADSASSLAGFTPSYFTNAANLTGTIPDSALSTNVPRLDAGNTFLGTNIFGNVATNGWIGSPTGPVQLHANGQRVLLIERNSAVPRITLGAATNTITSAASGASILGGENNFVDALFGTVAGGAGNRVSRPGFGFTGALYASIGGGLNNEAREGYASIAGGLFNINAGTLGAIGGGSSNEIRAPYGTIAGGGPANLDDRTGTNNRVLDWYGAIGGGGNNRAGDGIGALDDRSFATVAGGSGNRAEGAFAFVGGGSGNRADGGSASIGGGSSNRADGAFASVGGGSGNRAGTQYATVGGGINNRATGGGFVTIAGGSENQAAGFVASIAGGDFNNASGDRSFIGGGNGHIASATASAIAGGLSNRAHGFASFAGGGQDNTASGDRAVVGGGLSSVASGPFATISGGIFNQAAGYGATVVGGDANIASGQWSSVLGGIDNQATALGAFAAGSRARAVHEGSFVWSDRSDLAPGVVTSSTAPNQVTLRAAGGVRVIGNVDVSGNINYAAPRLTYRMYNVGEFLPGVDFDPDAPVRTGPLGELIRGPNGSRITFRIPINLPEGARIREVIVYFSDLDPDRHMRFYLYSMALPSQVATILSETTTLALGGERLSVALPIPTPIVVNNQTNSLEFVVQPARSDITNFREWSSSLLVAGMRIAYETDGPAQ